MQYLAAVERDDRSGEERGERAEQQRYPERKSVADPANVTIVGHEHHFFRFDEEHGIFGAPDGSALRVGDSVSLVPGYSPTTVNWYDAYHVVRADIVVDIWPVIPRGPGGHGLSR
ncbi:MAG: hypothetical protein ACLQFR_26955 [Streptosporangiaceae bacterium]